MKHHFSLSCELLQNIHVSTEHIANCSGVCVEGAVMVIVNGMRKGFSCCQGWQASFPSYRVISIITHSFISHSKNKWVFFKRLHLSSKKHELVTLTFN